MLLEIYMFLFSTEDATALCVSVCAFHAERC